MTLFWTGFSEVAEISSSIVIVPPLPITMFPSPNNVSLLIVFNPVVIVSPTELIWKVLPTFSEPWFDDKNSLSASVFV